MQCHIEPLDGTLEHTITIHDDISVYNVLSYALLLFVYVFVMTALLLFKSAVSSSCQMK